MEHWIVTIEHEGRSESFGPFASFDAGHDWAARVFDVTPSLEGSFTVLELQEAA